MERERAGQRPLLLRQVSASDSLFHVPLGHRDEPERRPGDLDFPQYKHEIASRRSQ